MTPIDGPAGPAAARVAVVVVTYNSVRTIRECLAAVRRQPSDGLRLDTIVVDNASSDGTTSVIRNGFPEVRIIESDRNGGYGGGNNLALRMLLQDSVKHDAILILNPDAVLEPEGVARLYEVLRRYPDVGAVSPALGRPVRPGSPARGIRSLWGLPLRRVDEHVIESDRLGGACMLVKPVMLQKTGLFDESYFLYWEELDLCRRARRAGFRLLVCEDIRVTHDSAEWRTQRIYYMWRNQVRFAFRAYGKVGGIAFLLRRAIANTIEAAQFTCSGRLDLLAAGLCGLRAGIRGETHISRHRYARSAGREPP